MDLGRLRRFALPIAGVILLLIGFAIGYALRPAPVAPAPDPERIADATLLSVRSRGVWPCSARASSPS